MPDRKIFRVNVELEFYVQAADEEEARDVGGNHADEALANMCGYPDMHVVEISDVARVPKDWLDAIPYGGEDDLTIQQILALPEVEPEPAPDTQTIPMFPEPPRG